MSNFADPVVQRIVRRGMLQVGVLSAAFPQTFLAGANRSGQHSSIQSGTRSSRPGSARNCILIWLDGGPSHLETWDPRPDAPVEVRGPLSSIPTAIPGIRIGECLPQTAACMHHLAVIRSMTSPLGEHNLGTHYLLTGYRPTAVLEYPVFAAASSFVRQQSRAVNIQKGSAGGLRQTPAGRSGADGVLPSHIAIPDFSVGGANISGHGYLPSTTAPFSIEGDPASSDFRVKDLGITADRDRARLTRRKEFMQQIRNLDPLSAASAGAANSFDQAFRMLESPDTNRAFDLQSEPAKLRLLYGPKTVGQACLLARRLIEHGVSFVTVNFRGWDTHDDLVTRLKTGFAGAKTPVGLIPSLDLGLAALLNDLDQRGLLDETLVVVMGEFGRTPKINAAGGRDHWPRAFSVALAGGGIQGGQVIGASDRTGESPVDRPVTPSDLVSSIYTILGIDPQLELQTGEGRTVRLVPEEARPVRELWT